MILNGENDYDIFWDIVNYMVEIECIPEIDAKKYLSDHNFGLVLIRKIKKINKKYLSHSEYYTKLRIVRYIQKYVKAFYEEKSQRQVFVENVYDDIIKYLPFYNPEFVKKVGRNYIGDVENSLVNEPLILKMMFKYPARKEYYYGETSDLGYNTEFELMVIIKNLIIENKLDLANELMDLLYGVNHKYFVAIFNRLIEFLEMERTKYNDIQINFLIRLASKTRMSETKINEYIIKSGERIRKKENDPDNYPEQIDLYKTDIITYQSKIIECINNLKDKNQGYILLKSIILDKGKKTGNISYKYGKCVFNILSNVVGTNKCIYSYERLVKDDDIIESLYNLIIEPKNEYYYGTYTMSSIFSAYIRKKEADKAIRLMKKIIDNKKNFANKLINIIVLHIKNTKDSLYIESVDEVVNYAKERGLKGVNDSFERQVVARQIKENEELDITCIILNTKSKMPVESIHVINKKIDKLIESDEKVEKCFDFEKVIEYVIENKRFFINEYVYDSLNYVDWYFKALEKIETDEILNSLLDNKIIFDDISSLVKRYIRYGIVELTNFNRCIMTIFATKKDNQRLINIVEDYVNMIIDEKTKNELQDAIRIIDSWNDDKYYINSESIEILNLKLKHIDVPNEIYIQFLFKVYDKDFKCLDKIFVKDLRRGVLIDSYIYEFYKRDGITILEKLFNYDEDFKKRFLRKVETKTGLLIRIKNNISDEDSIKMLKFLINNMEEEGNKVALIKELLYKTKYRELITKEELEYIKSVIISLKSDKYRRELNKKYKLLEEKFNKTNKQKS